MLTPIIRWSLNRPRLILFACLWFIALAAVGVRTARLELLPDLAPAQAVIRTNAPGLVAEQVEQLVTRPVEGAVIGAPGVAHVQSQSQQGLSVVTVLFSRGADPDRTRQSLQERIGSVSGGLPPGTQAPQIAPMTAGDGDVLTLGFTSSRLDPMGLRDVVQSTVRPRLLAAAGVAQVTVYGGEVRRIEVRARPGDLSDSDLGFLDILNAARRATAVTGAGFIDTPSQRVLIEPRGQAVSADDVAAGQIQVTGNAPVRIGDVSDVVEAPAPAYGDALIDGRPGVILAIKRQLGANTLTTTQAVQEALTVLAPALQGQGVDVVTGLHRPAGFITRGMKGLTLDLTIGAVLIALTLIVFMRDLRAVLITLASIPLTFLGAGLALTELGLTLNAMTLGGLALALGVVIDDAVIDVENILTRLRAADPATASRAQTVLGAALEVRGPIVYATLALVLAVSPMLAVSGAAGALLRPLAASMIFASLISLVVAVTVTPALCWLFLQHVHPGSEYRAFKGVKAAHASLLKRFAQRPRVVLILAGVLIAAAIGMVFSLASDLLPPFDDGQLIVALDAPPSSTLGTMRDYGVMIAKDLRSVSGVAAVSQEIGRDPTGAESFGLGHSVLDIGLDPNLDARAQAHLKSDIRHRLALYPGLNPSTLSDVGSDPQRPEDRDVLRVSVFGPSLGAVEAAARDVASVLAETPGSNHVHVQDRNSAPTVRVDLNFPRLALFGLSAADVLDTVQAAFEGETVARVYQGGRVIDVAVSAQASLRRDPETVGDLLLRSTSGVSVPLKRVANVFLTDSPSVIGHDNGLLRQVVVASAPSGGIQSFRAAARAAVTRRIRAPAGVFFEYSSPDAAAAEVQQSLLVNVALALSGILVLLAIAFDPLTAVLILVATLLSATGAVAAMALTGGVMSIGSLVGLIAVAGLSIRSAILLIDRVEHLVIAHTAPWSLETIERATHDRLVSIVMTSLMIALAMAPLAWNAGEPGREVLGPMAIVVLGGLVTSTLGSLLVLPILIHVFWRPGFGRRARRGALPYPPS